MSKGEVGSVEKLGKAVHAGADLVVVGNALEGDPGLLAMLINGITAFAEQE